MTTTTDALNRVRAAKEAAAELFELEESTRTRCQDAVATRQSVWSAMDTREQIIETAMKLLSERESLWTANNADRWTRSFSGRMETRGRGTIGDPEREERIRPRVPDFVAVFQSPGALGFDDLVGLAGPVVREAVTRLIQSVPEDRFGLPAAARIARLAELDAEILTLEAEHCAIVEAASQLGITFSLLPSVIERRRRAAEDAEREHQRAAKDAKDAQYYRDRGIVPAANEPSETS